MERKKFLISSHECYEGYCKEEDVWEIGSYSDLMDNEDVDNDTITWSQSAWEDEVEHFTNCLKEEVSRFEKRYNTTVLEVAMCGRMGLWNGSPVGGKIIDIDSPLSMNVDDIEVSLDEDGAICVSGHHHDGSHHMYYYFLTESSMKRAGIFSDYNQYGASSLEYEAFENIYDKLNPVKLSKKSGYFNYEYFMESSTAS